MLFSNLSGDLYTFKAEVKLGVAKLNGLHHMTKQIHIMVYTVHTTTVSNQFTYKRFFTTDKYPQCKCTKDFKIYPD